MLKNVASQKIGAQMVSASDGSAFTGSVTVYVTGDAGTQAAGSVGSGACTHEGNGYHTYAPAQAETNYDLIAFTFVGTGAIPQTIQIATLPTTGILAPATAGRTLVVDAAGLADANTVKIGPSGSGTAQTAKDLGAINVTNLNTLSSHDPGATLGTSTLTQSQVTGGAYAMDTDANGRVRIVDGTGAGELDTTSGKVDVNDKTGFSLSQSFPTNFSSMSITGGGIVKADLQTILATALTETSSGYLAAAFKKLFDVATPVLTSASVNQTGDSYSRIGATGSGLTSLAPSATALSTATWTGTRAGYLDNLSSAPPAASAIADAVWDEILSGHAVSGSTGEALSAAGGAGDPWITALPGSYTAGQAGYILGTYLDAAISGRATDAGVWSNGTRNLTALGFTLADSDLASGILTAAKFAADSLTASALATDAVQEIRNSVTGYAGALNTDANGSIRIVDGTGTGEIDTTTGGVLVSALATQAKADVNAEADTALSDYGPLKPTTAGRTLDVTATGEAGIDWGNIANATSTVNLSGTTIKTSTDIATAIAALNNLSAAQVKTQVVAALATDTYSLPGAVNPTETPNLAGALMQLYKLAVRKSDQDATTQNIYGSDGTTVEQNRTVSDDGTTITSGALVAA